MMVCRQHVLERILLVVVGITTDIICTQVAADCPCSNASLCQPVQDQGRDEIFIFSLTHNQSSWMKYNWTKITTIVMVGNFDVNLMCFAHQHGARAVIMADFPLANMTNAESRTSWVEANLAFVKKYYLDGINIDFEDAIPQDKPEIRDAYTSLVAETYIKFKRANKYYQVTVDVAWSPDCIDQRCYDYSSLADTTDFLFVMSYDEQSQITGPCVAAANSGYYKTLSGVKRYLTIGIPAKKLVLGIPWYGFRYPCVHLDNENVCAIHPVPFRGAYCSDAAGTEVNYDYILRILKNSPTGRIWDSHSLTPYFNYVEKNVTYQIWYDDPQSLSRKCSTAVGLNMRGVGMWNADALDYKHDTPDVVKQRADMWQALPDYQTKKYFKVDIV